MDSISCCRYEYFAEALANETRQAILDLLKDRRLSVADIVAHFPLSQSAVSHHLALLRRVGVVLAQRQGKHVYYSINCCCLQKCTRRLLAPFVRQRG